MTNIQLMEWLSKGNGLYKGRNGDFAHFSSYSEKVELLDKEVEDIVIRTWDSDEWVEPTYDIYLKDCKGGEE